MIRNSKKYGIINSEVVQGRNLSNRSLQRGKPEPSLCSEIEFATTRKAVYRFWGIRSTKSLQFGILTPSAAKRLFQHPLGQLLRIKYLGLASMISKNKKKVFNSIKDGVWKKLQGWKERLIFVGQNEILKKNQWPNQFLHIR